MTIMIIIIGIMMVISALTGMSMRDIFTCIQTASGTRHDPKALGNCHSLGLFLWRFGRTAAQLGEKRGVSPKTPRPLSLLVYPATPLTESDHDLNDHERNDDCI